MNEVLRVRHDCRLCNSRNLTKILSLKASPPANALIRAADLDREEVRFPMTLELCADCRHVQLREIVDPEILFRNYVYVTGTSPSFIAHMRNYAESLLPCLESSTDPFVCEIGSNDGTFLEFYRERGIRVLGIDPALQIAASAEAKGIPTWTEFFSPALAAKILTAHGQADLVIANNVFAHLDDMSGFVEGVRELLRPGGAFVFEVSYLVDVVEKGLFDTIYHEHLSYHSVSALSRFFERFGMELFDVRRVETHGGSLRGYVRQKNGTPKSSRVDELLRLEEGMNLGRLEGFDRFLGRIEACRARLHEHLTEYKRRGLKVAGFGAPAKATTLLHHFEFSPDDLDFIADDSSWKQGLFSPGHHIPILAPGAIEERKPDVLVILAWNFAEQIIRKNERFLSGGGRFLVPLPEVKEVLG